MAENSTPAISTSTFPDLLASIRQFAEHASSLVSLQHFIVEAVPARIPDYDWTGFYMLDPNDSSILVLGPFRGAPTTHVRIPVTEGICGAAVAQGDTIIIDDVRSDPRYLACSLETSSEIVVPIRVNGSIVGEIDIDSHQRAAFGNDDRLFLEQCAAIVGQFIEREEIGISSARS